MSNLSSFLTTGAKGVLKFLKKPGLSYKGNWVQVYPGTVIDSWPVGDFSTASYLITIEYGSNKKELMHVNVVARPNQASYNVFGRTSIDDELVTFDASVTNSIFSLSASPSDTLFTGAKLTFLAFYGETINPITPAKIISQSGGNSGGSTSNSGGSGGNTESGTGGVSLTALSVVTATAGTAALSYSNTSGVFTFTPPNLSSYVTSSALTSTLTGYATTSALTSAVAAATYSLPTATTSSLGGIKIDGTTLAFNANGQLYYTGSGVGGYVLPVATTGTLGGVKQGLGVTIGVDGSISYALPTATVGTSGTGTLGGVKVDGTTITINNGVISGTSSYSLPTASTSVLGGVKVDGSSIAITGGVISAPNGLNSRTTVVTSTGSLSSASSTTATITAAKGYVLYSIQVSAGAWVTVYTSLAAQSSDSSRTITTDPTPGSGVIAEAITTTGTTTYFTPAVYGYNADATPSSNMYLKIYNNSGNTTAITTTITYLKVEV